MRRVRSAWAVEVHGRITRVVRRRGRRALLPKALDPRGGFEQRVVDGEMLIRHQSGVSRLLEHVREKGLGDIPSQQAIAILGERGRCPHRVVHRQAHESAEQQVVLQLFHQQPLTAEPNTESAPTAAEQLSGGTDGRPMIEYIIANRDDSRSNTASVMRRTARSG
jgi:hypothetical protein